MSNHETSDDHFNQQSVSRDDPGFPSSRRSSSATDSIKCSKLFFDDTQSFDKIDHLCLKRLESFFQQIDNPNHLNEVEKNILRDLDQHLSIRRSHSTTSRIILIDNLGEDFKFCEIFSENLVIRLKRVDSFRQMCQKDQLTLLKNNSMNVMTQCFSKFLDPFLNIIVLPHPKIPDALYWYDEEYLRGPGTENMFDKLKPLFISIHDYIHNDDSLTHLLMMIALFDTRCYYGPMDPVTNEPSQLVHEDYVKYQYVSYCHLLKRHIQTRYNHLGLLGSMRLYEKIRETSEELLRLSVSIGKQIIDKQDPKIIGPLVKELLSLND